MIVKFFIKLAVIFLDWQVALIRRVSRLIEDLWRNLFWILIASDLTESTRVLK